MVGPLHFTHGRGAGGRQLAQPHFFSQNQKRVNRPADRTPTAHGFRHFGQVVEVSTFGFDRANMPNGKRMRTTGVSSEVSPVRRG